MASKQNQQLGRGHELVPVQQLKIPRAFSLSSLIGNVFLDFAGTVEKTTVKNDCSKSVYMTF
jgi:hypothetical protein